MGTTTPLTALIIQCFPKVPKKDIIDGKAEFLSQVKRILTQM